MSRLIPSATLSAAALATVVVSAAVASPAQAIGFTGSYAPANFTLENNNADGSAVFTGAPASLVITGGNNGGGQSGSTSFWTEAAAKGSVSFAWDYLSKDLFGAEYDTFSYFFANNDPVLLTTTSELQQSGTTTFEVEKGDRFGFVIETRDNLPGPATVTISNFMAPETTPAAVPTPALGFGLVGMGIAALRQRLAED